MPTRIYGYDGAPKVDFDEHPYYEEQVIDDSYDISAAGGETLSVLVSGGSMGGLFTAHALTEAGHDVSVFERSPRGEMKSQGAGIIAHPEMLDWIAEHGIASRDAISTSTDRILYVGADDEPVHEWDSTIYTSSWDTVYRKLRSALDDEVYHMGRHVTGVQSEDGTVTVSFEDARAQTGDLAVVAEGYRSSTRDDFLPDVDLEYAGYIAWRGTVPEAELSSDLFERFAHNYTFYHTPDSQILAYPVPGPDGEITPGERRINWVWYDNLPASELESYLRTTSGDQSRYSVAPGMMHPEIEERLAAFADERLPASFRRLVARTDDPFIQSVRDLVMPRLVFDRTCFIGDAATFIRPHMAAGTAKAMADGLSLAESLSDIPDDIDSALCDWEAERLSRGAELVARARHRGDIYTGRR